MSLVELHERSFVFIIFFLDLKVNKNYLVLENIYSTLFFPRPFDLLINISHSRYSIISQGNYCFLLILNRLHVFIRTFETWHSLTIELWYAFSVLKSRKMLNVIICLFKGFLPGIWKTSEEWKTLLYAGEWPSPWPRWKDAWQQMCPVCRSFVSIDVVSLEWLRRWSGGWLE